jgi:hypothetical protein
VGLRDGNEDYITKFLFDLFQVELVASSDFLVQKIKTGHICKFEVSKSCVADSSRYTVVYNKSGNSITSSRHKFEFSGILCEHALSVLIVICVQVIPDKCILKRWTINPRVRCCMSAVPESSKGPLAVWPAGGVMICTVSP